jgi:hypothetical protein
MARSFRESAILLRRGAKPCELGGTETKRGTFASSEKEANSEPLAEQDSLR